MNFDELKNFNINDLDVNNMGSWPTPVKFIVLVIVFGIVIGGGYYQLISPNLKQLATEEQNEQSLRTEFAGKQARAANLDAYKAQLEEMRRSFGAMLRQLPGKAEIDSLLIDIAQAGNGAGLKEDAFLPQPERAQEFYAEVPIRIRLSGDFHQFGQFASTVAALPRIVTLHDIKIAMGTQDKNDPSGNNKLSMDIIAKTYRYLEEEEQTGGQQ